MPAMARDVSFHSSKAGPGSAVQLSSSSLLSGYRSIAPKIFSMPKIEHQSRKGTLKEIIGRISNDRPAKDINYRQVALDSFIELTAKVTIRRKGTQNLNETMLDRLDSLWDLAGQKVILQLVSVEVDPNTGAGKRSREAALRHWTEKVNIRADKVMYITEFTISKDFGMPGAIIVSNSHQNEFYLETIAISGFPRGTIYFPCYSWVHSRNNNPDKRVFFSNQTYLPSQTPRGVKDLREKELMLLRGDGNSIRLEWDRIYDYATYNDLGKPDKDKSFARPTLGANKIHPYPRRCRTGRPPTETDTYAESRLGTGITSFYVPRDEAFEPIKQESVSLNTVKGMIYQLMVSNDSFQCFRDIDMLYDQGGTILGGFDRENERFRRLIIPLIMKVVEKVPDDLTVLQYAPPDIISRDKLQWLRDDEFGREVVAGPNPVQIERMKVFPPRSNLDPNLFGSDVSAIKAHHITGRLEGLSIEQAIDEDRLFILDYHDTFLPFINKINALEGRKMYASRTIFFRRAVGTLTPLAIELSLPPAVRGAESNKRVFMPGKDLSTYWQWQLAKAHVSSNDAGFHQLVNHWLRSHATVEPYIIATHRQLSSMHPISKLLRPHFRYTLQINASARQNLICADGIIEKCFTPGLYSSEISAAAYASFWRFDQESLPADLIKRGMAIEDHTQPEGLKLILEDYPYAADGLLIWSAIKKWVAQYISLYYTDSFSIANDSEIQGWWEEIRYLGHSDKKDEAWWPELKTPKDLQGILTTMIWIVSGFHAALNFGQYAYGGYVPNRPCMTRRLIPEEGSPEYEDFVENPEKFFLSTIPSRLQAISIMGVLDTLSTHSRDEEYLGQRVHTNWTGDKKALKLAHEFSDSMNAIEREITGRNKDPNRRNRHGNGVIPYELLLPSSSPGRTGRGIPNSISI